MGVRVIVQGRSARKVRISSRRRDSRDKIVSQGCVWGEGGGRRLSPCFSPASSFSLRLAAQNRGLNINGLRDGGDETAA
jgi:hypothetical protein